MAPPKTDDFRLERRGDELIVTFTPDGRTFSFRILGGGRLSTPVCASEPAGGTDQAQDELRMSATRVAELAVRGGSRRN